MAVPAQNASRPAGNAAANTPVRTQGNQQANAANSSDNPFIRAMSPGEKSDAPPSEILQTTQVFLRLLLAVVLSGILAFRPRKNTPLFRRSLFVSQTQILLAVVAAALMLIVGDNTARAFAIFAAVSLVSFELTSATPRRSRSCSSAWLWASRPVSDAGTSAWHCVCLLWRCCGFWNSTNRLSSSVQWNSASKPAAPIIHRMC